MSKQKTKKKLRTISPEVIRSILFLLDFVDSLLDEQFAREADGDNELSDILNLHVLNEMGFHIETVRNWEDEEFLSCNQNDDVKGRAEHAPKTL